MRTWALGSNKPQSKKQMEKPQEQILLKCPLQPSQSNYYYHNKTLMKQWKLSYGSTLQNLNLQKFQLSSSQTILFQSSAILDPTHLQLPQDKKKEVKTLLNYLPVPQHSDFTHIRSALHFALNFTVKAFNCSQYLRIKVEQLFKQENITFKGEDCMRRRGNKLAVCYSYKWRQLQSMVYLLVQSYKNSQKQASKVRIHIINKRGLILQTVSNLDYQRYHQDIILTINKHYSKIHTVVIIHPQSQLIHLDHFRSFMNQLGKYNIIMITLRNRHLLKQLSADFFGNTYLNHIVHNTYIFIDTDQDIVICHNATDSSILGPYVSTSMAIILRQNTLAEYFDSKYYFSAVFNQKQMLLRLFSFYFNFLALEQMFPDSKDQLVSQVLNNEMASLQLKESEHQSKHQNAKTHTLISSSHCLYCIVCNKRTKFTCQKCLLTFSPNQGLCQKGCFEKFHTEMQTYIPAGKNKKREQSQISWDKDQEEEELLSEQSLKGRKRIKEQQNLSDDSQDSNFYQNLAELRQKWREQMEDLPKQYNILARYASVGAIPGIVVKKIDYLLQKTKAKTSYYPVMQSQLKKEEIQP